MRVKGGRVSKNNAIGRYMKTQKISSYVDV